MQLNCASDLTPRPKQKIEAQQVFLESKSAKRLDALTEEMLLGVKVLCTVWEG